MVGMLCAMGAQGAPEPLRALYGAARTIARGSEGAGKKAFTPMWPFNQCGETCYGTHQDDEFLIDIANHVSAQEGDEPSLALPRLAHASGGRGAGSRRHLGVGASGARLLHAFGAGEVDKVELRKRLLLLLGPSDVHDEQRVRA
eukprot:2308509-Pleurochrysis_carterae.AAC.2